MQIITEAEALRSALQAAVAQQAVAFDAVIASYGQPKGSDAEKSSRAAAIEHALDRATVVPLQIARHAVQLQALAVEVVESGNVSACSNAAAGAHLAHTALRIAALNVRINQRDMSEREEAAQWLRQLEELEKSSSVLVEPAEAAMRAFTEPA